MYRVNYKMSGYTIPDKVNAFLSDDNRKHVARQFYQRHVNSGGTFTYADFEVQVLGLMKAWPKLSKLNSYESLIYGDMESERHAINEDFIQDNRTAWDAGSEYKTLTATYKLSADDYGLLDVQHNNPVYTSNGHDRYNNTIPMYQSSMNIRHYATQADGMHESLMQDVQGYTMDEVYTTVDKPYSQIDYLAPTYFGPTPINSDSSTGLLDTNWK